MTSFKRTIAAATAAALLASSAAYAEVSPLPAGKPAGTRQADLMALSPIFWIGLAAIGLGIGFAVSNNGHSTTTTSTSGTGG